MNSEAAGAIGEIIGAVAVVASLVFVGFQLRQNTRAMKLSSTNDLMSQLEQKLGELAEDKDTAELVFRGIPDPKSLEGLDLYRFTLVCQSTYFYMAKAHYQYRAGTLEPEIWATLHSQLANFMNTPGMARYWKQHGWNFPEQFRAYIEDEVMVGADAGWSLAGSDMPTPGKPTSESAETNK